jgi:hypothetical protein
LDTALACSGSQPRYLTGTFRDFGRGSDRCSSQYLKVPCGMPMIPSPCWGMEETNDARMVVVGVSDHLDSRVDHIRPGSGSEEYQQGQYSEEVADNPRRPACQRQVGESVLRLRHATHGCDSVHVHIDERLLVLD